MPDARHRAVTPSDLSASEIAIAISDADKSAYWAIDMGPAGWRREGFEQTSGR